MSAKPLLLFAALLAATVTGVILLTPEPNYVQEPDGISVPESALQPQRLAPAANPAPAEPAIAAPRANPAKPPAVESLTPAAAAGAHLPPTLATSPASPINRSRMGSTATPPLTTAPAGATSPGSTRALPTSLGHPPRPISATVQNGAVVLEIDPGVGLPAALHESATPFLPAHAAVKERIAQEFDQEVAATALNPTATAQRVEITWTAAKARADERFRALFGEEAYQQWSLHAAREPLQKANP